MELIGPAIRSMQEQYLNTVDDRSREEFESSLELITESRDQFIYDILMCETVNEDHVYNVYTASDGSGMIMDVTKGFFQHFSAAEMLERERGRNPDGAT